MCRAPAAVRLLVNSLKMLHLRAGAFTPSMTSRYTPGLVPFEFDMLKALIPKTFAPRKPKRHRSLGSRDSFKEVKDWEAPQ